MFVGSGHRSSFGVVVGVPLGWGWPWYGGYYPPYYGGYYGPYGYPGYGYYPPAAVSTSPPVYVERGTPDAGADQYQSPSGYWYYCRDANGYYPYVKQCPGGWERVAPTPER
ncbi:MAG TPA: hypothetical protein VF104_00845 [Burkholderiales bacterium]